MEARHVSKGQQHGYQRVATGILGLDHILRGGLPKSRLYVVEGYPGSGKTTLAMQFLLEGIRLKEKVLYITLSETTEELDEVSSSHGWSLDGLDILPLSVLAERLSEDSNYTVYHPADVELTETIKHIKAEVERLGPVRVALDSVSELRTLAETNARYRREVLGLKQFFAGRGCTVLILDDRTSQDTEQHLQSIAHGVLRIEKRNREYGESRRELQIIKMRGVSFRDGLHDFAIRSGGVEIYPRMVANEHPPKGNRGTVGSGVDELDQLLGGGLDEGSSTLVMGGAGSGKTTICNQFLLAALSRGESAVYFLFEENKHSFLQRAKGLSLDLEPFLPSGQLQILQLDPASISPGEFAFNIRRMVEERGVSMLVIDSLNGYLSAMPSEKFLLIQMHELLNYLNTSGVVTLLTLAQHGMMAQNMTTPIDISFLADTVILLRFFEALSEVRQAISILKKRRGAHEHTIRELRLGLGGVRVGSPLLEFEGILTGVPRFVGDRQSLINREDAG